MTRVKRADGITTGYRVAVISATTTGENLRREVQVGVRYLDSWTLEFEYTMPKNWSKKDIQQDFAAYVAKRAAAEK